MSKGPHYDRDQFVRIWLEAYKKDLGQAWVAKQCSTTKQNVQQRAGYLRSVGVKLPSLTRMTATYDRDRLNQLIADVMAEKGDA